MIIRFFSRKLVPPTGRGPYSCAETLMEIGMIYAEKAMREEALTWFRKVFAFIKVSYSTDQGLQLMVKSGFSVGEVVI